MSEVRLVAMRLVGDVDPVLVSAKDGMWPDLKAWENGITEEEAERAMHVSGSYTDERRKLRSAFSEDE